MTSSNGAIATITITTTKHSRRLPPRRRPRSQCCTVAALALLGSILLLLSPHFSLVADAFANNLVETNMGCMTDLSTEEVIMNNEVRPPEDSDFPKMHLVVLDGGDDKHHHETPYRYDVTATTTTIRIAFVIPYSTSEFNEDLQFVMEVEEMPAKQDDSGAAAAEFVDGGSIGCEKNKRLSARHIDGNGVVTLRIHDPTATLRVWAGWATGHSAVRLVPDLVLEPRTDNGGPSPANENDEREKLEEEVQEMEEKIEAMEEAIKEEEFRTTDQEKALREQEEQKLERLLLDDPNNEQPAAAAAATTKTEDTKLKRKRKNALENPGNVPEGLLFNKQGGGSKQQQRHDLGMDIGIALDHPNAGFGSGGRRAVHEHAQTLQQRIRDHTLDIDASQRKAEEHFEQHRHKLSDHIPQTMPKHMHVTANRQHYRADKEMVVDDGGTDDDLPEVVLEAANDDFLPDEGLDDDHNNDQRPKAEKHYYDASTVAGGKDYNHHRDGGSHVLACLFFAASMGLIWFGFGRKRDKGRRDL